MRRAFALLLLCFAIDAVAEEKPLVPFDLVKMGVRLLQVRRVAVRGETQMVEFRDGRFRMRVQVTPRQTVVIDLNASCDSTLVVSVRVGSPAGRVMASERRRRASICGGGHGEGRMKDEG